VLTTLVECVCLVKAMCLPDWEYVFATQGQCVCHVSGMYLPCKGDLFVVLMNLTVTVRGHVCCVKTVCLPMAGNVFSK
jgi:hypothetical protein